jgi:hypothetical protein
MRASSLSNAKIIDLLNQYFIPAHADGVYYQKNEAVAPEEKTAYQRIFQDLHQLNQKNKAVGKPLLSVGTVHAYVLTSDGKPFASLHVAEAGPEKVTAMLQKAVETLKVAQGKPVAEPTKQSAPPSASADALVLHLTARYLVARARPGMEEELVPVKANLGAEKSGQWSALPSEDWIVLKKADWQKLLPGNAVQIGNTWEVDKAITTRILTRFYTTTENNDLATNRIDRQALHGTVVSIQDGVVRARLQGSLKMKHTFYPNRDDNNHVDAAVVGYVDFAQDRQSIRALRLVTEKATYGGGPGRHFGVAVRSIAPSATGIAR